MNPLATHGAADSPLEKDAPAFASRQEKRRAARETAKRLQDDGKQTVDVLHHASMLASVSAQAGCPVVMTLVNEDRSVSRLVLATADPEMERLLLQALEDALFQLGQLAVFPEHLGILGRVAARLDAEQRQGPRGILQPGDPGFRMPGGVL